MRLQTDKLVKQIVEWNPSGTRKGGRPDITWNQGVRINIEKRNINYEEWLDRDTRKRKVLGL
jgi:hypothetical protein